MRCASVDTTGFFQAELPAARQQCYCATTVLASVCDDERSRLACHAKGKADYAQKDDKAFQTARAYFLACAERKRAATRALFTSGVGALAGTECEGLDGADAELARYALDLHELGPKNVIVAPDEPTRILAVVDWQSASVRPLWRCARTPYWLLPSLVGDDDARKQRLRSVFRAAVAGDSVFARAVDTDDMRHALDEVAEYDTFRDGFLVLPTLQSVEDVDGLRKLLDPQTLVGWAARISLLTHGPGVLSLATSTPGSPLSDSPLSFGWNRKLFRTRNAGPCLLRSHSFHGKAIALDIKDHHAPSPALFIVHEIAWQDWIESDGVFDKDSDSFRRNCPPPDNSATVQPPSFATMNAGGTSSGKGTLPLNADVVADILAAARAMPSWKACEEGD
ncbi:hypothetical protein EDB83DRAFT_2518706 [Lactarius deliciosus]|nr:hypothetical protein EDB83DRAFT_2518706 [Lactarius deliciosus]